MKTNIQNKFNDIIKTYFYDTSRNKPNPCSDNKCIFFAIILVILSFLFALIEIELEGKFGWSEQTPTPNIGSTKNSLTLYHLYMALFMFLAFATIFFVNSDITINNLIYMFAIVLWFFTLEDLFWFVLNPNYKLPGLKDAWWHNKIDNRLPVIYILFPILSTFLAFYVGYGYSYINTLLVILIGVAIVIMISPIYHIIYEKTHKNIYEYKNLKEDKKN
tara:strand:- start:1262 stop:1915 length:654 start_codon:yes stop_codon:yes gene_type:complete